MASKKQVIDMFNNGKVATALNYAKSFKLGVTDEERDVMSTGYECFKRPEFYQSIGQDVESCKEKAIIILKKVLGLEETKLSEAAECTGSFGYGLDEMYKAFAEENARGEGVDADDTNQEYPTEEEYAKSIKVAEAIGLGKDVEEEDVETEPKFGWILSVINKKTKNLECYVIRNENLDNAMNSLKTLGFSFVCLVSTDKARRYVDTESVKGMKGVLKALENRIDVTAVMFYEMLLNAVDSRTDWLTNSLTMSILYTQVNVPSSQPVENAD